MDLFTPIFVAAHRHFPHFSASRSGPCVAPRRHVIAEHDAMPQSGSGMMMVVDANARSLRVSGAIRLDLDRRRTLRRVLLALVRARIESPGAPVSVHRLFDEAWQGERALSEAAASRVYVAISTLRRMGLRRWLVSREDGYLFDPSLEIELRAPASAGAAAPTRDAML